MVVERVLGARVVDLQDGLRQLGADLVPAQQAHKQLRLEPSWREGVRVVRQEAIGHNSLPLVVDTIVSPAQGDLRKITESLKSTEQFNLQIYEVVMSGKELAEKNTKNNRLAALFHNKGSSRNLAGAGESADSCRTLYNLVVFLHKEDEAALDLVRVEITTEISSCLPCAPLARERHFLRWRALLALEADLGAPPRQTSALLERLLVWQKATPPPPLIVAGRSFVELKLEEEPSACRVGGGLAGVEQVMEELANCGRQGEKELLTRLRDAVLADTWELLVFQVWTVAEQGSFRYNLVIFCKGGITFRCSLHCLLAHLGNGGSLHSDHLDLLKLTALQKLRAEYKDLAVRATLPGGQDVGKVVLPLLATPPIAGPSETPASHPTNATAPSWGFSSLFRSSAKEEKPASQPSATTPASPPPPSSPNLATPPGTSPPVTAPPRQAKQPPPPPAPASSWTLPSLFRKTDPTVPPANPGQPLNGASPLQQPQHTTVS